MTTEVQTVFTGSLNTQGTRTSAFQEGDYIIIIAPLLQNQGLDVEIDVFLQLVFTDNTQRLIRLEPVNLVDTNAITIIPTPFRKGNDRDLYLFLLSDQPYLVDVLVISNTDDDLQEIKDLLNRIEQDQSDEAREIIRTIIDLIRVSGGDFSAALPLLGNIISGIDSLVGVELPSLPPSSNDITEISSFF